jgi:hypothetical protein
MTFWPCPGGRSDYPASPWTGAVAQQTFGAEADSIDYLVLEA